MISVETLRELQADYEPIRLDDLARHEELEQLRIEFLKNFPRSKILGLTLDEYVQGKGSKDSFCYWVERKLTDLGHIQGATADKFGIYYSKEQNAYRFVKKYNSESEALRGVLNEISTLLSAAEKNDMELVKSASVSPMFKGKILFLYFPKTFINIYSERLIDHFLFNLRINQPGDELDLISKRDLLISFKNSDAVMKDWSTYEFHDFLHWAWPPPPRDSKVAGILRDYIVDLPLPEQTSPEFISLDTGKVSGKSKESTIVKTGVVDFEQKNKRAKIIGNQGEDIVFLAEKMELRRNGRNDLAQKVEAKCKSDDGAGFDILSYELDGTPKQIEVKSTSSNPPGSSASFRFFLSANEHEKSKSLSNYHLYIVFAAKSKNPKIWRIKNPAKLEPDYLNLQPSAFVATLTIA